MENQNINPNIPNNPEWENRWRQHKRGKIFGGFLLVIVGGVWMAKKTGVELPEHLFNWKTLLILIGLFMGVKHGFRHLGWLIPIGIGSAFLLQDFYPEMHVGRFFWPVFIIIMGLVMIFRPRRYMTPDEFRNRYRDKWNRKWDRHAGRFFGESAGDDRVDSTAVFGSVKKNIITKDFKGGEITSVFGGTLLDMSQADINGRVYLEVVSVFGGAKLIVPRNWQVQTSGVVTLFGGIDDKRPQQDISQLSDKVLVLDGSAVFGGIDISNY